MEDRHEEDQQGREQVLILVKALPRAAAKGAAPVFAAGLTAERQWRRLVPSGKSTKPGRRFARWQWIAYDWRDAHDDTGDAGDAHGDVGDVGGGGTDRHLLEGTLEPGLKLAEGERAAFVEPLIAGSLDEARDRGDRFALVRPRDPLMTWKRKRPGRLDAERRAHALAAPGLAFLGGGAQPVEPCPYEFRLKYDLDDGRRDDPCGDWEIAALFDRLGKRRGEKAALDAIDATFNLEYPRHGMACALAADGAHPGRWHLVGVMGLAEEPQLALL